MPPQQSPTSDRGQSQRRSGADRGAHIRSATVVDETVGKEISHNAACDGVFISYSQDDAAIVARLVEQLRKSGVRVSWDEDFAGGKSLNITIRTAIANAASVLVVWSKSSAASPYVEHEARLALKSGKLVTVHVDGFDPYDDAPMGFGHLITIPIDNTKRILRSLAEHGIMPTS